MIPTTSAAVSEPSLGRRLREMGEIIRAGGRWNGNEFDYAAKEEPDVAMLDDLLTDAIRLARTPAAAVSVAVPAPAGFVLAPPDVEKAAEDFWVGEWLKCAETIHYPGCWDLATYPALADALSAVYEDFKCSQCTPAAPVSADVRDEALEEACEALHKRLSYPTEACAIVRALKSQPTPVTQQAEPMRSCAFCNGTRCVYRGPVGDPPEECEACFDQSPADAPVVPLSDVVLRAKLRVCVEDPMWSDYAEVSKNTLRAAISALSQPAAALLSDADIDFIASHMGTRKKLEGVRMKDFARAIEKHIATGGKSTWAHIPAAPAAKEPT